MANNYLDNLVNELMNQGIQPVSGSNKQCVDDRDLKIIAEMERVTGLKYSDEQRAILEHKGNACILACAGSGKALVNGTGVLTPFGYVNIETLKIGDKVFDQDGREQIVLGVYPQGKKKVHKVHFAAGEMIKCCEEHLWTVKNKYDYWETVKTSDINKMLEHQRGVEIPSVSGSADDFLYGYCSDSYLGLLERMLPSKQRFKELLDIENNEQLYEALSVYNSYDDYADTVEIMYKIFEYGNYPILFIKHEEMKNAIVTAFEFFGTSTEVRELDEEERNRYCASYALTFDNHFFDFKQKYITRIEETEEYEEMTCIKVSGLSELFLTEHCIVTHNTSVSTHLIAKRILTGEISDVNKLIYTTYSKAGATEMKERLDKLLKQLGINKDVQVRTLHSFFLQVLRTFGVNSDIISASTRSQYIREACKDAEFIPRDDDLMLVDNLISYQVNNLLNDKKTIDSYVNTLEDLTLEQYTKIRSGYATRKAAKGLIDYDDMQSFLYLWLVKYAKSTNELERQTAEAVRNYCKAVWTDFYIDEAQDVSKIQFAIIRAMVTDPNDKNKLDAGLVFIGDDDQCIYTWRGSDPSIILTVGPMFNMKTFKLTTNYRCYNEIVDYAVNGIKCNTGRYEKGMQASKQGGTTKICVADREDLCSLSILALNHIKWWLKKGSSVKDIAVLSRNNFHLALLSNMLLREGIYCNMTEDMKLTKSYMYQDIKMLLDISEPSWKPDVTQKIMWKLCRFLGAASSKVISEFQNNSALSLEDTLGYIVKHYIDKDIYFEKKLNIPLQASQKMEYFISSKLTAETKNDIHMVYNAISCGDKEQCYKALAYMYIQGTSFLYKSKDKSRSINGLVMYIANLIKKDGFDRMLEFLRVTEQLENGNMVIPGEKLTLTTIHSAKGREWKNVIMFACDNISEPSLDGMVKMMEDDISVHDIFENLNEERRLFYVGNTRAKENLVTITNKEPSVFILEALGVLNDKTDGNNGTILSFAQDRNWFENYRDIVHSIIMDKNSKYFYDKDAYTLN